MGLIADLKTNADYILFREEVSLVVVDIFKQDSSIERFEMLQQAWHTVLGRHQIATPFDDQANVLKYFSCFDHRECVDLLAKQLALIIVPNFSQSVGGIEHKRAVKEFMEANRLDMGSHFNELFRQNNPRSFEKLSMLSSAPPFSAPEVVL